MQVEKIRHTKSNIVGAAYKIAMVEAFQDHELSEAERQALSGSANWWKLHREEVLEMLALMPGREDAAA